MFDDEQKQSQPDLQQEQEQEQEQATSVPGQGAQATGEAPVARQPAAEEPARAPEPQESAQEQPKEKPQEEASQEQPSEEPPKEEPKEESTEGALAGEQDTEAVKPAKKTAVRSKKKSAPKKKKISPEEAIERLAEESDKAQKPAWYVIHTLSGQENKVKDSLDSRLQSEQMTEDVLQVLIPTENVSEVKSGKKTVSTRKFFPGYILVSMLLNDRTWYYIRNTPGVIGFIGTGKPVPLQDHEVQEILTQIEEKREKVKPKVMFEIGESIKVNDGPFVNFTGSVEEVNPDRGKLKVMVSIFGRATPIELEYWQVERT